MIKAIFFDFYGTVVHEDNEIVKEITQESDTIIQECKHS